MNAAFLLVTSAMLVGQGGGAGDKKPAPAPAASSCGSSCDCDSGHRLRDRLRGFFNRDCNDSCAPAACAPAACHTHSHAPLFRSRCEDACKPKCWTWERPCREPKACAPACAPACPAPKACGHACHSHKACAPATCDSCERSILTRLRERLQRDRCCDSGCGTTTAAPVKGAEKVDVPAKKLPVDPGKGKKPAEEVRIETQPVPFAVPVSPSVPSVEIVPVPAPAPAPRVEDVRRDPF